MRAFETFDTVLSPVVCFLDVALAISSTFWVGTKKLSLGIAVRLLWAAYFNITQNETTQ